MYKRMSVVVIQKMVRKLWRCWRRREKELFPNFMILPCRILPILFIRSTIFNLRPMTFDDLGLKASFERLLDFLNADRDYIMDVEIDDVSCETDDYFCITLYRVVQECLLNIKKHSQATRVLFHCKKTEQQYEILIQDNGKGFTMEEAEDKSNSHFGLALTHEGVVLLNGTIHISSEIGKGTTIDIKIPLDLHLAEK